MKRQAGVMSVVAAVLFIATGVAAAQSQRQQLWGSHMVNEQPWGTSHMVNEQSKPVPTAPKVKCFSGGANPVFGKCANGKFVGYFAQTGKPVYGDCAPGGGFNGYNPENGSPVYGKCN